MDKISGILPSSYRTRKVDVSQSQPVRPGAPAWGRPVGRTTQALPIPTEVHDRVDTNLTRSPNTESPLTTYKPNPDAAKVKIADDVSAKFFSRAPKEVVQETTENDENTLSEQMAESVSEL